MLLLHSITPHSESSGLDNKQGQENSSIDALNVEIDRLKQFGFVVSNNMLNL